MKGHDEICLKIVNIFVWATCALAKMWPVWPMILFLFYKAFLEKTVVKIDWLVLPAQFDDDDDDLDLVQRLMNPDEVSGL